MRISIRNQKKLFEELYLENKLSIKEIAGQFGLAPSFIWKLLKDLGIQTRRHGTVQRGEHHARWKGGKFTNKRGYTYILTPNHPHAERYGGNKGYIAEHRLIAEKALGRLLKKGEVVHHINGNPRDNRNKNLLICTVGYHTWLHQQMAKAWMREHFQ